MFKQENKYMYQVCRQQRKNSGEPGIFFFIVTFFLDFYCSCFLFIYKQPAGKQHTAANKRSAKLPTRVRERAEV